MNAVPVTAAMLIRALLPDDGSDKRLLRMLLQDHGIARAESTQLRSVGVLNPAPVRSRVLPEAEMARLVTVVVDASVADIVFEQVCHLAHIGRPGGGMVLLQKLSGATAFVLPPDLPQEA